MYNVHGMSGLQFRNEVGGKKSYPGTRLGLFMPLDWDIGTPTVYICEGFSDTVAMTYAGFRALGRACATHNKSVVEYVETYSPERVIIVADNDEIGKKGANHLKSHLLLHTECGILIPELKDARETLAKLGRL
jgi:5S rRNA maturation endonuclease (ribonuclease M5)